MRKGGWPYWALNVVHRVPQLLAGEQRRLIWHLGDLGIAFLGLR